MQIVDYLLYYVEYAVDTIDVSRQMDSAQKLFTPLQLIHKQKNNTMKGAPKAPNLKSWEDDTCTKPHTRPPLNKLASPDQIQQKFADTLGNMKTSGIKKSPDEFQDMLGIMKMCQEQDTLGTFESGDFDGLGSMNLHYPVKKNPVFSEPDYQQTTEDNANFLAFLCTWQIEGGQGIPINFDSDSYTICIDTGASCCISNDHSHFVLLDPIENVKVTGIASGLTVKGMGIVKWTFMDDSSQVIEVPDVPMCLLIALSQLRNRRNVKGTVFMP